MITFAPLSYYTVCDLLFTYMYEPLCAESKSAYEALKRIHQKITYNLPLTYGMSVSIGQIGSVLSIITF